MLEELNDQQIHLMATVAAEYEENALSGDDSYDPKCIQSGIDFIYELAELKKPEIIICASPMDMKAQANLKKGETIDEVGCGYDSGWTAYFDFFERIGIEYDKEWNFKTWKEFILNSGVFATVIFENVAFVCIRPCLVKRNANGYLHCKDGPAIAWRDGYQEYSLNGVWMDEEIVITLPENIDPKIILKEKNAEVRREIVRKIGVERVCEKLNAKCIDKFEDYELLLLDLGDNRKRPYLKMKNPSIGVFHIEGVAPNIKTVKEGLAWRNGQTEYIAPKVLS